MSRFLTFFFTLLGALAFWLLKGMNTPFNNEASGRLDSDFKYYRNLFTGIFLFTILFFILKYMLS
jgi:hypothetical protein